MAQQEPPAAGHTAQPTVATGGAVCGELMLTEARLALLTPKLHALLRDFQHLAALEEPELEPAFGTVATGEGNADDR